MTITRQDIPQLICIESDEEWMLGDTVTAILYSTLKCEEYPFEGIIEKNCQGKYLIKITVNCELDSGYYDLTIGDYQSTIFLQ